ncbi:LacI family DNA-binding transcriptional regulator [Sphingobium indicum]|uniref:LacI family DNA-binding transcriptional regulator n=1 Tax=Sphingobium indicum TaxID=332055 RepID=A0A4Q4J5Y4_9SPHN|nr:LacI family DNA-binding transcriptional regulator [Sphingobium indicum]NYI23521.1 LacI family transcriptional regulator [Sphingobium indicum]RYM01613.1 LacI family DNA-binding transcriptional regulator [Sphingobium indicum]
MNERKPPTIREVAARAGVSVMTVSRVANKQSWVSPQTRARVEQAIAELNYAPNVSARALAGGDDRRVALLYRNTTTSAYLGELLLGGLDEAAKHHLHLVVEQCETGATADDIIAQILQARVSGVIVPPPLCDWDELAQALTRQDIPWVAIAPDENLGMMVVVIDDRQAASEMTRHLIDLGHRRIAFIQGNPQHRSSARRLEGFRAAMTAQGLAVEEDYIVEGDFSYRSGLEAASHLLSLETPPTAIFACNDDMAAATITIAHQRQISVPADLTVCGFDDTPLAAAIWPTLTTIRQPIRDMSRAAMTLLAEAMKRGDEMNGRGLARLDYSLVRRQSDAVPRLNHRRA